MQKDIVEMIVNVGVTKYHQIGRKRTMSNDDIETAWQEGKAMDSRDKKILRKIDKLLKKQLHRRVLVLFFVYFDNV